MKIIALALASLLFADAVQDKKATPEVPVFDRAKLAERIDELAQHAVLKEGVPGLTIAVAEGDDVFFAKGYGYADAEHGRPSKDTMRYPIGTLTRQFTAVAILQLVDAEKIDLEKGLETYLPEFPLGGHKVTLHQMLSNTSGIPGFEKVSQKRPMEASAQDKGRAEKEKSEAKGGDGDAEAAFFAQFKGVPFDFEPGTDFSLESANYALLSMIVARVSKLPYTQYVQEKILEPVGMNDTQFCPIADFVVGLARDCKSEWTATDFELPTAEAGKVRTQSLCTTASDLVKWQQALLARAVFSEKGSRRFMAPTMLADGNSTNFGYAIQMSKFHDFKNYAYTGQGGGFRARLSYWSLPRITIVVLSNCDSAPVERIEKDIARFVLSVPLPPAEEMSLSSEDAARCAGLYQIATTQYRIEKRDGQLWFVPPVDAPTRLCHRGQLVFALESNRDVTLAFHVVDGRADGFTLYRGGFENKARRMD